MLECKYCNKKFKNKNGLHNHITKKHIPKENQLYRNCIGEELNITNKDLESYIKNHPYCEICGKTIFESRRYEGKFKSNRLCVDHNHTTNEFRGMLCQSCNRQLG